MRIGWPGQARLSLVRQSPLLRGRFSFQDEVPGSRPILGAAGGGSPCQARSATRSAAAPASGRAWSTFGPHAIGAERFLAVSSGISFAQVAGPILGKRARG